MENWKPIEGYEGCYEVSDLGRVRSLDRYVKGRWGEVFQEGKILKGSPDSSGHIQYMLYKDGGSTRYSLHRTVAEYFVDGDKSLQALHRDDDKNNNKASNLYWGTHKENMRDQVANKRKSETKRTHCPRKHPLVEPNLVKHQLKVGKRACWSCAKAHDYMRRHDEDFQTVSDRYFLQVKGLIND